MLFAHQYREEKLNYCKILTFEQSDDRQKEWDSLDI